MFLKAKSTFLNVFLSITISTGGAVLMNVLTPLPPADAQNITEHVTNKWEVRRNLEDGWIVLYSREFSHNEYIRLSTAIAADVAGGSGGATYAYFSSFAKESLQEIYRELGSRAPSIAQEIMRELTLDKVLSSIRGAFDGRRVELSIAGLQFQVGRATYNRAECERIFNRCITLPNTYQPYVRFRMASSNRDSSRDLAEWYRTTNMCYRIRAVNDWALRNGYQAGLPNLHQADHGQGIVFGTILLRNAEVQNVLATDLGRPSTSEARFRAVHDWALRNGYQAGFPNFHDANHGRGIVFGTVFLRNAEVRDLSLSELGNPLTSEDRFRAINDWALRNGYRAGFPNFHQADHGQGVVFGAVLLRDAEVRNVPVSSLERDSLACDL